MSMPTLLNTFKLCLDFLVYCSEIEWSEKGWCNLSYVWNLELQHYLHITTFKTELKVRI